MLEILITKDVVCLEIPTSTDLPFRFPSPILNIHPSGQLLIFQVDELTRRIFNSIESIIHLFTAYHESSYSTIRSPKFLLKELVELVRDRRIRFAIPSSIDKGFEACIAIREKIMGYYVAATSVLSKDILQ